MLIAGYIDYFNEKYKLKHRLHKRLLLTMPLLWLLVACLLSLREIHSGVNVTRVIRSSEGLLRRQKRYLAFPTGSNLVVGYDSPKEIMRSIDWFCCSWQCPSLNRSCRSNRRVTTLLGSATFHFLYRMIPECLRIGTSPTRDKDERCTLFWCSQWNGTSTFFLLHIFITVKGILFVVSGVERYFILFTEGSQRL